MDQCRYGIAVFGALEREPDESRLNPNVCTELSYMLSKGEEQETLILKDKRLDLPTDFKGSLYDQFNGNRLDSLSDTVGAWAEQVVRAFSLRQRFVALLPGLKFADRLNEHAHEKKSRNEFIHRQSLSA